MSRGDVQACDPQYDMDAELPDPSETNNPGIAGLFAGAQNYSVK